MFVGGSKKGFVDVAPLSKNNGKKCNIPNFPAVQHVAMAGGFIPGYGVIACGGTEKMQSYDATSKCHRLDTSGPELSWTEAKDLKLNTARHSILHSYVSKRNGAPQKLSYCPLIKNVIKLSPFFAF